MRLLLLQNYGILLYSSFAQLCLAALLLLVLAFHHSFASNHPLRRCPPDGVDVCLLRRGRAAVHHSISIRSISFIKRAVSDKATIIF